MDPGDGHGNPVLFSQEAVGNRKTSFRQGPPQRSGWTQGNRPEESSIYEDVNLKWNLRPRLVVPESVVKAEAGIPPGEEARWKFKSYMERNGRHSLSRETGVSGKGGKFYGPTD